MTFSISFLKVSSPQATPETQNVISVVNQMEKDEEVARRLQVGFNPF